MTNGEVAAGVVAGLAASVLYGSGPVAQALVARNMPPSEGIGLALTMRLARKPLWLAGMFAEVAGFALEAFAFSAAPATLVAPLLGCDMLVFVLLGAWAFRERLSRRGIEGAIAMGCGVAVLAAAFGGAAELGSTATDIELWCFLAATVFVTLAAVLVGNHLAHTGRRLRAGVTVSLAAGIGYGLAALATRQIGRTFDTSDPWDLLSTPTPWVLAGCSILGIALLQRGLQASAALAFPITSAVSAFIPVVVGAVVFDDEVPAGPRRGLFVVALILIISGVGLLARDRSAAERATGGS